MAFPKTGVLLLNLGTPDSPKTPDVRRYLRQFLMDERVIDIPTWKRNLLVKGIIAPFRAPKSAAEYQKLWTDEGSPIKTYGYRIRDLLQEALGNDYHVALGMRYQNPSVPQALDQLRRQHPKRIIVVPLFPQYSSAASGSAMQEAMETLNTWQRIPEVSVVANFFDRDDFLEAFAERGRQYLAEDDYDYVLFSYHGLPERQIKKGDLDGTCQLGKCCNTLHDRNYFCYRAQCFATSRMLAEKLGLAQAQYGTSFQSRLGKTPWIKPYTDEFLQDLAEKGVKKVLCYSPSFVADCLETTIEIGETYQKDFLQAGGEKWQLVASLNDHPQWVDCLKNMVLERQAQPLARHTSN